MALHKVSDGEGDDDGDGDGDIGEASVPTTGGCILDVDDDDDDDDAIVGLVGLGSSV
jgi:hypothetical protein